MVASDDQLVSWREIEEVATHETRGQNIAASHVLDLAFVPTAALRRLLGDRQPDLMQACEFGRMPIVVRAQKHLDRAGDAVGVEDGAHGVDEGTLTVSTGAVEESKNRFRKVTSETIHEVAEEGAN